MFHDNANASQKWTLDEFRCFYNEYTKKNGYTSQSLNGFFFEYINKLPIFPEELFDEDVRFATTTNSPVSKLVSVNNLRGNSWLFKNENPDGKPFVERLVSIFLQDDPNKLPAIPANQISDDLFGVGHDGNHRIYAAYLRGSLIKILCW